jgi:hypothetical protein
MECFDRFCSTDPHVLLPSLTEPERKHARYGHSGLFWVTVGYHDTQHSGSCAVMLIVVNKSLVLNVVAPTVSEK